MGQHYSLCLPSQALELGDSAQASPVESVACDSQARTQDHLYKTYQINLKTKPILYEMMWPSLS
jgi:hypothetical protein